MTTLSSKHNPLNADNDCTQSKASQDEETGIAMSGKSEGNFGGPNASGQADEAVDTKLETCYPESKHEDADVVC